jgi:hypothetical protein
MEMTETKITAASGPTCGRAMDKVEALVNRPALQRNG